MTRSSFLLLDANIVIQLFKSGSWQQFAAKAQIQIARTILSEAHYFENEHGERVDFDLNVYVSTGAIEVVEVGLRELEGFLNQFDPSYAEKLDPGEAESLAYLMKAPRETRICSADAIVFRVLGNLDRGEQGLSLEEALDEVGLGRKLPSQFGRKFRSDYTAKGVAEWMQGRGVKR